MTRFARFAALSLPFLLVAPAFAVLPPPAGAPEAASPKPTPQTAKPTPKPAPAKPPKAPPPATNTTPNLPPPAPSDDEPIIVPPGGEAPIGDEPIAVPTERPATHPTKRPAPHATGKPTAKPTRKPTPHHTPTARPTTKPTPRRTPTPQPIVAPNSNAPHGYPYLLSQFSTKYDASLRGRTQNLRMAARNVNGTVVPEGRVFSTNKAIGRRDASQGWQEAKMFVNGQVVTGTGAGICQCSTTIYNAALLGGLPIVERHPHTFRVMYAPASRDAAIAWGQKDFKFRNNTKGPLFVRTFVRGGRFHVELWNTTPTPVRAKVESHITSRKDGTHSEAYRIVYLPDGTAHRERLSRDFYRPHP